MALLALEVIQTARKKLEAGPKASDRSASPCPFPSVQTSFGAIH